jgi:hypothetical protein
MSRATVCCTATSRAVEHARSRGAPRRVAAPAARPRCPIVRASVLRDSAALPAAGRALSRCTRRPRGSRSWRHSAARRCCFHWRCAGSFHARCSTAQRSHQCYSRAGRAGQSHRCLAQLADAHLAHRCCSARLLPWRTPQAALRFAPLFRAVRLRRILLAALHSLCCGLACAVPCYARVSLSALFAVSLSIALQSQQCACWPFLCSADVDT